jgi:hypothetical protein
MHNAHGEEGREAPGLQQREGDAGRREDADGQHRARAGQVGDLPATGAERKRAAVPRPKNTPICPG